MKELEGCDPDDARFDTLLRQLMEEIRQHVAEEEGELFPKLASHARREELETLGSKDTVCSVPVTHRQQPAGVVGVPSGGVRSP